jgi:hypothetical protein
LGRVSDYGSEGLVEGSCPRDRGFLKKLLEEYIRNRSILRQTNCMTSDVTRETDFPLLGRKCELTASLR